MKWYMAKAGSPCHVMRDLPGEKPVKHVLRANIGIGNSQHIADPIDVYNRAKQTEMDVIQFHPNVHPHLHFANTHLILHEENSKGQRWICFIDWKYVEVR